MFHRLASRVALALVVLVALLAPAGCKHTVDLQDQDRDAILGQLDRSTTDLTFSLDGLQAAFARERARFSQELQQTFALAIADLRGLTEQLDRSIDKMRVSITNFQQDTASTLGGAIERIRVMVQGLENNLATDTAAVVAQALAGIEREREALLKQTHQTVEMVIRPTLERLTRDGDRLVGKVTIAANVVIVRVVTGLLAAIGLIGMVLALLKLKSSSRRAPAVAILALVLVLGGASATVLAGPIAAIGARTESIPSGAAVCGTMDQAWSSFRAAVPGGVRGPGLPPDADELAMRLKDAAIECEVFAPTEALATQARDAFAAASRYFDQRVSCTTDDQCVGAGPGFRCDVVLGTCARGVCTSAGECAAGQQCVERRCVDGAPACATPVDCRPEESCDRATARCVVTASIQPTPCEVEGLLGPCRQGVRGAVDRWVTCKAVVARAVEACNGVDDDCDGTVDQGLVSATACIAPGAVGACADGHQVCAGSAGWQCEPRPATDEVAQGCNNRDDDCDQKVDEGVTLGGSCSAGIGGCADRARLQCVGGATICVPGGPVPELCGNGVDDDCDSTTDGFDPDLAAIAETCNGRDDNCNGATDEGQFCHPVMIELRDVDDETYVWVGESSDTRNAACVVKRRDGGSGRCDLVLALRDRGIGPGRQLFTIMTVNSGCFGTSAHAEVATDVETKEVHHQSPVTAHCGWVERDQFEVELTTGQIFRGTNWGCVNDGNCRP